jgi:2,4-dienoyl-CoA reductase-like NADH-dependent reductase (Old Yellow Enzyme family)
MRSPAKLIGSTPVCPSADEETGSRALTLQEVKQLRDDFIAAAVRSQQAGYDGVEIHGAHGYIVCQFLSELYNRRDDEYGGTLENRARLLFEIVNGIRQACGPEFLLGVRLSPERFGIRLAEALSVCEQLIAGGEIDFLDISLWDSFKLPEEEAYQGSSLLSHFAELSRGKVLLTVAGKIMTAEHVRDVLAADVDFVTIGRGAILHHDYPRQVMNNDSFEPIALPVSRAHLAEEGLSETFIEYMNGWKGFVADG